MRLLVPALLWLAACDPAEPGQCPGRSFGPCPPFEGDAEREAAFAEVDRLAAIQDRHEDEVMAVEGVLSMGIGYDCGSDRWVFVVGYDRAGACPEDVPDALEGVAVVLQPSSPVVVQPAR